MSGECVVKKPKLLDEERAARNNASKKAWAAKHCEQRRAYQLVYARCQRQALLDAGFVPNPVGRPKNDPDTTITGKTCAHRGERGDAYREYQKVYQRQLRARRRAEGWLAIPCGFISPQQVEALKNHRGAFVRPEKSVSPNINTNSNQNGEQTS